MLSTRVAFRPSPALYPFTSRTFASAAGLVHYVDEGAGPPLLLLHGNPTWSFLYRKLIPRLTAAGFRCIAPDLLGHGLSEHPEAFGYTAAEHAAVIAELIRHLDLEGLVLVANDWGGPIGLRAALAVPERLRGFVLGSTFAWPLRGLLGAIGRLLAAAFMQRYIVHGATFVPRVMRLLTRVRLSPEELAHYAEVVPAPAFRRGIATLPRQLGEAGELFVELQREIPRHFAQTPTLLLLGSGERLFAMHYVVRPFQRLFGNNRVVVLPGAGHFFQEDAPEAVTAAMREIFGSAG